MSDWLRGLQAAPSLPPGLAAFAESQPSAGATWQYATRADWLIWMAAHGFAGSNTPRDIVSATVILADFAPPPTWRLALRLSARPEDVLRHFQQGGDFNLGQIVAHVYLGLFLGAIVGTTGYLVTPKHSLLVRELISVAGLILVTIAVVFLAQRLWAASVRRARVSLAAESPVAVAVRVAVEVSERSSVMKQVESARIVRKALQGPPSDTAK